jgi:hypothetical protein
MPYQHQGRAKVIYFGEDTFAAIVNGQSTVIGGFTLERLALKAVVEAISGASSTVDALDIFIPEEIYKVAYGFVTPQSITSGDEDSNYPLVNVLSYEHRKKYGKINKIPGFEGNIDIDFGVIREIIALFLDDVSFTKIKVMGNSTQSWGSPPYEEEFNIFLDERTQRYKLYETLSNFNYRYMRLNFAVDTQITDGSIKYKFGRIVFLGNAFNFDKSIYWPYDYYTDDGVKKTKMKHGGNESVSLGDLLFRCSFGISAMYEGQEERFWAMTEKNKDESFVMFENAGNSSQAYFVKRDTRVSISEITSKVSKARNVAFRETS